MFALHIACDVAVNVVVAQKRRKHSKKAKPHVKNIARVHKNVARIQDNSTPSYVMVEREVDKYTKASNA